MCLKLQNATHTINIRSTIIIDNVLFSCISKTGRQKDRHHSAVVALGVQNIFKDINQTQSDSRFQLQIYKPPPTSR